MTASFTIGASVLREVGAFMEERGALGFEASAMLAGTADGRITRAVMPDQIGHRSPLGVAVEVTDKGKLELAAALALDELWLARIHSHPDLAFHSETDDRNPALTAEGAISIVVPFFGLGLRRGLEACAVFVLTRGRWVEVVPSDVLEVTHD
jgi:hypothetical protein